MCLCEVYSWQGFLPHIVAGVNDQYRLMSCGGDLGMDMLPANVFYCNKSFVIDK